MDEDRLFKACIVACLAVWCGLMAFVIVGFTIIALLNAPALLLVPIGLAALVGLAYLIVPKIERFLP